ncbi:arsenite methyltransferase [Opitutales bacterium ASA1]|uniref:arsenite methyltransferase n=1 Tax=Congregicoccus parvus TaxID=3081749 RepID=UPI002B2BF756|nr:arsenite methyltransferase [Opitutales bacterium ASA1]
MTQDTATESLRQDNVREAVRERYASIALRDSDASGCGCTPTCCSSASEDATTQLDETAYAEQLGYSANDTTAVPAGSNLGLGCGNPIAIASIRAGETVVDLGSGAGFDCFLAANQLAGTGRVIGVDMTPAMISKARRNAARSGHANVEFRLGEIEALPIADGTADLIISNCVINLSPDKPRVFREAFRALKPGGRLSISDVVARAPIPASMREDFEQVTRCIAGAETIDDIRTWLAEAGFVDVRIAPREDSRKVIDTWMDGMRLGDIIVSALIEARKP